MGIDAPEKAQPFGQRAKKSLSDLVFESRLEIKWDKRDRYNRVAGKVLSCHGTNVCLEQIARGLAWHYMRYAGEQLVDDRISYDQAEKTV